MRKHLLIGALLCLLAVSLLGLLASCNAESQEPPEPEHTHEWGEWTLSKEPNCTDKGLSERVCACGEIETKILQTVHAGGENWIIEKEATLRDVGAKYQICTLCQSPCNYMPIPRIKVELLPGITDTKREFRRPKWNLGSCRELQGTPVVVLIFVDDAESSWTAEEVETFKNEEVLVALDYLEKNARKRGIGLGFKLEQCYATALCGYEINYDGIVNKDIEDSSTNEDLLDQVAADIGCEEAGGWELYSYYKAKYPNNEIIFLNCLNKGGSTYSRLVTGKSTSYAFVEHGIVFAEKLGRSPAKRVSGSIAGKVAQAILFVYGGGADYDEYPGREDLMCEFFPSDILYASKANIWENTISPYTEYAIGWATVPPDICYKDGWW